MGAAGIRPSSKGLSDRQGVSESCRRALPRRWVPVWPLRLPRRPLQTAGKAWDAARLGRRGQFFPDMRVASACRGAFSPQNAEESRQKPRRCAATTRISGKNCRNHACPCADARRNLSKPAETAVKTAPKPAETRPAAPKPSDTVQPLAVPPYRRTAEPPYRRTTPRLAENRAPPRYSLRVPPYRLPPSPVPLPASGSIRPMRSCASRAGAFRAYAGVRADFAQAIHWCGPAYLSANRYKFSLTISLKMHIIVVGA